MTLKELSQLYYIGKEIETLRKMRATAYDEATSTTQTISNAAYCPLVSDKVGNKSSILADIDARINRLLWQSEIECEKILSYIEDIDDAYIRIIMELRFLRKLPWWKVARELGGGNTEDSVKKAIYRHLRKNK